MDHGRRRQERGVVGAGTARNVNEVAGLEWVRSAVHAVGMDTQVTVLAAENIRQGELVTLTTVGVCLLRQASEITADTIVARAAEPIMRGSHGKIVFLETKPCPQCQQTMVLEEMFVGENVWTCLNRQCDYSEAAH